VFEDEEQNRIARILHLILFTLLIASGLITLITWLLGRTLTPWLTLVGSVVIVAAMWLMRRGYLAQSGLLVLFTFWGILTFLAYYGDGIHDTALVAYPALIVAASLLLNRRLFTLIVIFSMLSVFIIAYSELRGDIVTHHNRQLILNDTVVIIILVIITAITVRILTDNLITTLTRMRQNERALALRAREMTALYDTSLEISQQTGDLSSLLNTIVRRATTLLDVERGLLSLVNPPKNVLELVASHNLPDTWSSRELPLGQGLAGRVAQSGQPLMVADYGRWEGRVRSGAEDIFKRIMGVPLKQKEQVVGVLAVFDLRTTPFTEDQLHLLSLFAAQAAIAIENTRLFQAEQHHRQIAETLSEIARVAIATLSLDEVLNHVIQGLTKILLYDTAAILLIEGELFRAVATTEGDETHSYIGATYPMTELRFNNYVVQTRRAQLIPDTQQTEHFSPVTKESAPVRSVIGIPFISQDNVIGVMSIGSYTPQYYSQEDVQVAFRFAQQVAVAIDNARLYEQAQREIAERIRAEESLRLSEESARRFQEQLKALHAVSSELARVDSFDDLCRRAVELGRNWLGFDRLGIWFVDAQDPNFILGTYGTDENGQLRDERGQRIKIDSTGLLQEILSGKLPLKFQDGAPLYDDRHQVVGRGWIAVAAIWDGDKIIGCLNADNFLQQQPVSDYQLELLKLYGITLGHLGMRQQAEESLKSYSEQLEDMVEARTRELKETQERLLRQEKLAVLSQLAGGVAHELRNPLGVISNAVYFLQMVLPDADATVEEYLKLIHGRVDDAEKIITGLLSLSQIKAAVKETVIVSALVAERLEAHPPPETITVATTITSGLPPIFVDPQQIGQVLGNLIINAYQAMPNGGQLAITAQVVNKAAEEYPFGHGQGSGGVSSIFPPPPGPAAPPHNSPLRPRPLAPLPNYVALTIMDTGVGMPAAVMANIFEPLYTTKAKGIGLGLVIAKNLTEVNGGSIEVESVEGHGSTFVVKLPIFSPTDKLYWD
jgi:signal transduction histidine kinase/putative methionine-R-sulfoxide reductase with GAF domain